MHIIKKYENRKLYSTKFKRYIVLKDLVNILKNNKEDIQVIHYKTKKDLTSDVLKETLKLIDLDVDLLKDMVRSDSK